MQPYVIRNESWIECVSCIEKNLCSLSALRKNASHVIFYVAGRNEFFKVKSKKKAKKFF